MNPRWQRSEQLLSHDRSLLVLIDVQDRLLPSVQGKEGLTDHLSFLLDVAALLEVPVIATEQYPAGLGRTVNVLAEHPAVARTLEKIRFSAAECLHDAGELLDPISNQPRQIVLTGIETHICVQQTALDLLAAGHAVYLPTDASASRHAPDREMALDRMKSAGVRLTTSESVAFEWCEEAGTEKFRRLSRLVKERDQRRHSITVKIDGDR